MRDRPSGRRQVDDFLHCVFAAIVTVNIFQSCLNDIDSY